MKKEASIVFQVNFSNFDDNSSGKTNRLFTLYRQLRRKRQLARFCREAFIEKAIRHLSGQENSYQQLDSLIKSKGVAFFLDSTQRKEVQIGQVNRSNKNADAIADVIASAIANAIVHHETNQETDKIPIPVLQVSGIPNAPTTELQAIEEPEDSSIKKIDLEKLKGLL